MSAKVMQAQFDEHYHAPLLRAVESVVRDANIPEVALYQSMVGVCSEEEIEFMRGMRRHARGGIYGMVLEGRAAVSPLDRFSLMAGACLRNYIAARVMTVQDVLEALENGNMPDPTVLLIPNFYVTGSKLMDWQVSKLLGLLYSRQSAARQTVVYVSNLAAMTKAYGSAVQQHLCGGHFMQADAAQTGSSDDEK